MISPRLIKFIFIGSLNTGLSYLIYLIFLIFLPYSIAYSLSFVTSILISYFLNTYLVFNQPWCWKKLAQFPLVYLVQYSVGLLFLSLMIEYLDINEKLAPLLTIILLIPLTYILTKRIINGRDS